jgi:hypothetical protein
VLSTLVVYSSIAQQPSLGEEKHHQAGASAKQQLHRVDFRVVGSSCVVCLRRVGKELRDSKGVLKADVSIFKPYWGIAVYDASQTNFAALEESIRKEKVRLEDVEDKPISELPALLLPKTTPADEKKGATSSSASTASSTSASTPSNTK